MEEKIEREEEKRRKVERERKRTREIKRDRDRKANRRWKWSEMELLKGDGRQCAGEDRRPRRRIESEEKQELGEKE